MSTSLSIPKRTISIAPMLDWTDRHERFFLRLITRHALLYTEMVTTGALIHGDTQRYLAYNHEEHPVALQLGGSDPVDMAKCAALGEEAGYDEININVGCPSERVQKGAFGACLMLEPNLVAECVLSMSKAAPNTPITVKCRIGVDEQDSYEVLHGFVSQVASAGCDTFIIHARKAWLTGLSPKQNRDIPPLDYPRVAQLKRDFPHLSISLNGGVVSLDECERHLQSVDGVMIGREAYHNPYHLAEVDKRFYDEKAAIKSRADILDEYEAYMQREMAKGTPLKHMTRHILGLFHGEMGAKAWRRHISEQAYKPDAGLEVVRQAKAYCLG